MTSSSATTHLDFGYSPLSLPTPHPALQAAPLSALTEELRDACSIDGIVDVLAFTTYQTTAPSFLLLLRDGKKIYSRVVELHRDAEPKLHEVQLEEELDKVKKAVPAGDAGFLLVFPEHKVKHLTVSGEARELHGKLASTLEAPKGTTELTITHAGEGKAFAFAFVKPETSSSELTSATDCHIYPPPFQLLELHHHTPEGGWKCVSKHVLPLSERLVMSSSGMTAAWFTMLCHNPEEAERGEVFAFEVSTCTSADDSTPIQLTHGAGRVGDARCSPTGDLVVFSANFSQEKPITTHMQLWQVGLEEVKNKSNVVKEDGSKGKVVHGYAHSLQHLLEDERGVEELQVDAFEFIRQSNNNNENENSSLLCVSVVSGCEAHSVLLAIDHSSPSVLSALPLAVVGDSPAPFLCPDLASSATSSFDCSQLVYVTESDTELPYLRVGTKKVSLPHSAAFSEGVFRVQKVKAQTTDGAELEALFYEAALEEEEESGSSRRRHLLVHAHGGPAIAVRNVYRHAAAHTRYPYRALLKAGYKVVMPLYRGTLGYGDEFAAGNIGKQGTVDMEDIMAVVKECRARQLVTADAKLGVFGGSYGGFLTNCAVCKYADDFSAGVSEYGFLQVREMTLEGGDFSWETEYTGEQVSAWPIPEVTQRSGCYASFHQVKAAVLFTHGEDDDICPLSQSRIAYNMLKSLHNSNTTYSSSAPMTGLVTYPGEGHGYDQPPHREDRAARILLWFQQHMQL